MKELAIRALGGKALADLADRLEHGDHGERARRAYVWLRGKKRWIGLGIYLASYTAAATASALGGCVTPEAAVVAACAWVVGASRVGVWTAWGVSQLGILDYDARRLPEGGYARELSGAAGHQAVVLAVVVGSGLIARALHVPAEILDTFESDVLWVVLGHIGLISVSTAARVSRPEPRPIHGRGPR